MGPGRDPSTRDRRKVGGQAATAIGGCGSVVGRNFCHLVAWIRQESSKIRHLWRLTDSEVSSLFSGLAYSCNKVAIVRNIEVIAQSPNGFDDACREAIREASKTLRGISSFWIKNAEVVVENDQITMFRVNGKISFLVEDR